MYFLYIDFIQLMSYGIHIGHSIANTLSIASSYVFAFRLNLALIDLFITIRSLRYSVLLFSNAVFYHAPVWFINLDSVSEIYTKEAALSCGEFFVLHRWTNGAISNYFYVYQSWKKYSSIMVSLYFSKQRLSKPNFFDKWYLTRFTWPRLTFFTNIKVSSIPLKESFSARIPSVGVSDTNSQFFQVSVPIPGNDEAIPSLIFYNNFFSTFVLVRKFANVVLWFSNVRVSRRILSFVDWVTFKRKSLKNNYLKRLNFLNSIIFSLDLVDGYSTSISLLSSLSNWFHFSYEKLDLFVQEGSSNRTASKAYFSLLVSNVKLLSFISFQFILRRVNHNMFFIFFFSDNVNFQSIYLRGSFLEKSFLNNLHFRKGGLDQDNVFLREISTLFREYSIPSEKFLFKNYFSWYRLVYKYMNGKGTKKYLNLSFSLLFDSLKKLIWKNDNTKGELEESFEELETRIETEDEEKKMFNLSHFFFLKLADLYFLYNYWKYYVEVPLEDNSKYQDIGFLQLLLRPYSLSLFNQKPQEVGNFKSIIDYYWYQEVADKGEYLRATFPEEKKKLTFASEFFFLSKAILLNKSLDFTFSEYYHKNFTSSMLNFWNNNIEFLRSVQPPRLYLVSGFDDYYVLMKKIPVLGVIFYYHRVSTLFLF